MRMLAFTPLLKCGLGFSEIAFSVFAKQGMEAQSSDSANTKPEVGDSRSQGRREHYRHRHDAPEAEGLVSEEHLHGFGDHGTVG